MKIIFYAAIQLCLPLSGLVATAQEAVTKKLNQLTLPTFHVVDAPLSDALAFVQQKSVELDPAGKGVNIVILAPQLRKNPVTLKMNNASLGDVLQYTVMLGGGHMRKTRHAVTISNPPAAAPKSKARDNEKLEAKLKSIVLPSLEFFDTPVTDALEFLATKSQELDPKKNGINFVYHGDREVEGQAKVTLRLSNIPLYEVLNYTTQLSQHQFSLDRNTVLVTPL